MSKRLTRRSVVDGVICVIAGAGFFWLDHVTSPYPAVDRPPDEKDRVWHPAGFSIVKPGRTTARLESDALVVVPDGGRSRYTPSLIVRRWGEPPDMQGLREGHEGAPWRFQGDEAWVFIGPTGKYVTWAAVFRRGGDWFTISLSLPEGMRGSEQMPSAEWLAYLNTFKATGKAVAP